MKFYFLCTILLTAALLTGCSRASKNPEDEMTAVLDPIEAEIPDGGVDDITPSIFPEQEELIQLPSVVPYPEDFSGTKTEVGTINYFNYRNRLPFLSTEQGNLEFDYNGGYSFTDFITNQKTQYHIGDFISASIYSQGMIDYNNWYFMGALKTSHGVYVHYDYLGSLKMSFFIRMEFDGSQPDVCASVPYISQEPLNAFTATETGIYFTYVIWKDDVAETSLIYANPDGSDARIIYTFEPEQYVSYLFPAEQKLYFLCASEQNVDLMEFETETRNLSSLLSDSKADFLYVVNDYCIISADTGTLTSYNMRQKRSETITITSKEQTTFSAPFYDQGMIYVAVYSLDHSSPTQLYPILLEERSIGKMIQLSDSFYYCLGISNGIVYTENGPSYRFFELSTGKELQSLILSE